MKDCSVEIAPVEFRLHITCFPTPIAARFSLPIAALLIRCHLRIGSSYIGIRRRNWPAASIFMKLKLLVSRPALNDIAGTPGVADEVSHIDTRSKLKYKQGQKLFKEA